MQMKNHGKEAKLGVSSLLEIKLKLHSISDSDESLPVKCSKYIRSPTTIETTQHFEVSTHPIWFLSLKLGYNQSLRTLKCSHWNESTQSLQDAFALVVSTVVSSLQLKRTSASNTLT